MTRIGRQRTEIWGGRAARGLIALCVLAAAGQAAASPRLTIAASDHVRPLAERFQRLLASTQPKIALDIRRSTSGGVAALSAGVADVALVERAVWELERRPFRQIAGQEPSAVQIGYVVRSERGLPPAVYVHARNPIASMTMDQVARTFATGLARGDIATWGQLRLAGPLAGRRIHAYGPRDDGGFATNLRLRMMGGRQFAPSYEPLSTAGEVLGAIAGDPAGIAILDAREGPLPSGVRAVAIAATDGAAPVHPSAKATAAYPLSAPLLLYFDHEVGAPLAPGIAAYTTLALSPQGQAAIAADGRFAPLEPGRAATERARIQ